MNKPALILAPLTALTVWTYGLPHLPGLGSALPATTITRSRTEPVLERAVPNVDLTLTESTVAVTGRAVRRTGPCTDTRTVTGTVTVRVVMPRTAVDDGPTITVHPDRFRTVTTPHLTTDADDGACSRLAHLIGRPTSSPGLNADAERQALTAASNCTAQTLDTVGGPRAAAANALAAWGITRPVTATTGTIPPATCLTATTGKDA